MQYFLIGVRNPGFASQQFLQAAALHSAHELHASVLHGFGLDAAGFGIEPMLPLAAASGMDPTGFRAVVRNAQIPGP